MTGYEFHIFSCLPKILLKIRYTFNYTLSVLNKRSPSFYAVVTSFHSSNKINYVFITENHHKISSISSVSNFFYSKINHHELIEWIEGKW